MSSVLLVAVLCLATHRISRLLTRDQVPLIKVPRDALLHWLDPRDDGQPVGQPPFGSFGRSVAYLLECDWCTSVYVAGALVWVTAETTGVPWPWLVWPVASTVTGLLASYEGYAEQRQELMRLETEAVAVKLKP